MLGGVPRGAIVLVGQVQLRGAPRDEFYEHMERLGLDLRSLEEQGLVHQMEALTVVDEEALIAQLENMAWFVEEHGIRRLVVDSVAVILQMVGGKARARGAGGPLQEPKGSYSLLGMTRAAREGGS